MEMHTTAGSEKEPDESPDRLHSNDAGSFVMPEKQRVMSDCAGWHGGSHRLDKKIGRLDTAPLYFISD
jgi:hypothetical protein